MIRDKCTSDQTPISTHRLLGLRHPHDGFNHLKLLCSSARMEVVVKKTSGVDFTAYSNERRRLACRLD